MSFLRTVLLILTIIVSVCAHSQDTTISSSSVPPNYLNAVSTQAGQLENKLDKQTAKVLRKWKKQEERIHNKLAGQDSSKAKNLFGTASQQYASLDQRLQNAGSLQQYIPGIDTLNSSLKFLQQHPELLSKTKQAQQKLKKAIGKTDGLSNKFQQAEEVKKFLAERKQYLRDQLANLGYAKQLKRLSEQTYYYAEHIKEYKSLLKDHKKAERKAIALLSKTKPFKDFMRKNSHLASLFRLPGDPNDPASLTGLSGLQTRVQVNNLIQQQIASSGPNAMAQVQQNMKDAQSQLNQLKDKILKAGGSGNSDDNMPEGFKPNNQKTKSFLKRLEFGTNIQSQKSRGYFPATSDIGLSIGYKLNDRSIIGIGASYKLGLGKDIRHMKISQQGVSIRTFIDWRIKGSFWLSGGHEMNYRTEFKSIQALRELDAWQQSGLIGVSKVVSLKTKILKQTKLQLLWNVLSYRQMPRSEPILFRIGYTF